MNKCSVHPERDKIYPFIFLRAVTAMLVGFLPSVTEFALYNGERKLI